jgi:hypothetical protein
VELEFETIESGLRTHRLRSECHQIDAPEQAGSSRGLSSNCRLRWRDCGGVVKHGATERSIHRVRQATCKHRAAGAKSPEISPTASTCFQAPPSSRRSLGTGATFPRCLSKKRAISSNATLAHFSVRATTQDRAMAQAIGIPVPWVHTA